MADMELLAKVDQEVRDTEEQSPRSCPRRRRHPYHPAASLGGSGLELWRALGDPTRFKSGAQVYRLSGLVPRRYESAGKIWTTTKISREGRAEFREAILELGKALRQGHPNFARYAASLKAGGKAGGGFSARAASAPIVSPSP
jgi:transposase